MSLLFPNPLRIRHVLLMMSPWLPIPHQNLPNPRVPSTAGSGLTPLIFLTTVTQTLWQVSYPFPRCPPPPNSDAHDVNLPPLALCSKIPKHFFHGAFQKVGQLLPSSLFNISVNEGSGMMSHSLIFIKKKKKRKGQVEPYIQICCTEYKIF